MMMKNLFSLRTVVLSALLLCLSVTASAASFVVSGISYDYFENKKANASLWVTELPNGGLYTGAVTIPASVQVPASIDENQPVLPVVAIKADAFKNCTELTAVSIPASVTAIKSNAFYGCTGLTKVTFASIESACAISYGKTEDNPLTLAHHLYVGNTEITNLVIPNDVTTIKSHAFAGCSSLTSVTIPSSVKSIGSSAFSGNTGLKKAVFESVGSLCSIKFGNLNSNPLYLANHLFFGNNEKTDVTIPNGVTQIPAYTFAGGTELTKVTIPASVTLIGASAFKDCKNLNIAQFSSIDHVKSITYADKDANPLSYADFLYINNEDISEITFEANINDNAFPQCKWLRKVTISDGVETIGEGAFKGCTNLESVSLPSTLKTIGKEAFNGCSSLTSPELPASLEKIGNQAFRDCKNKKFSSVTIPAATTDLGEEVFMYCSNLTTATLQAPNLTTIPRSFFYGCSRLSTIILPATMQTIGEATFYGCEALTVFPTCPNLTTIGKQAFASCKGLANLTLKDTKVSTIGENAFENCSNIANLTLPATTAIIQSGAFIGCQKLTHVYSYAVSAPTATNAFSNPSDLRLHVVSKTAKTSYEGKEPWNQFGTISIMSNRTLTFIVNDVQEPVYWTVNQEEGTAIDINAIPVPDGIFSGWDKDIPGAMPSENMTFYGYVSEQKTIGNLSYHLLPAEQLNGKNLQNRAYVIANLANGGSDEDYEPYTIENIVIPSSVTDNNKSYTVIGIEEGAFRGCSETYSFELPTTITEMGVAAFKGCSSITSFTIPSGVKVLSDSLFYGCESLSSISGLNTVTKVGTAAFHSCKALEITSLPSSIKKLGQQAFRSCENIRTLEIPTTLTEIEPEAFFYCLHLKSVSFAEGFALSIPQNMFKNCFDLESITLRGSMRNIGEGAFENCTSLASIVIPEGFKTMGKNAFNGCTQLSNITLPSTLESIGNTAFGQCQNINQLTVNRQEPPAATTTAFDEALAEKNAYLFVPENADRTAFDKAPWNYFKIGSRETKTLTFIVDDGEGSIGDFDRTQTLSIMVGDKITPLEAPEYDGHEFSGWQGLPDVMPNEDVTVTGKYKYEVKYYESTVSESSRLLGQQSFWYFYGDEIVTPDDQLHRDKNTYELTGQPEDGKMPAQDLDVIVNYSLSEADMTVNNINYKVWILQNYAEVMPSSSVSGTVTIPETVKYGGTDYPVKVIHEKAFWEKSGITAISLPSQLTTIGTQAFRGCGMKEITIPASVTELAEEAFLYCGSLNSISFAGNGITTLPNRVFQNCSGLTEIDWPSSLQAIGEGAFNGCTSLTTIDLPATVTTIGNYAFIGCSKIENVILNSTTMPTAESNIFDEARYELATLTVPVGVSLSSLPTPWSLFSTRSNPEGSLSQKCATPTISYNKGTIEFACATAGVTFVSEIKVDDAGKRTDSKVDLNKTYVVTVYAKKDGYKKSDTVTGTIPMDLIGDVNGDGTITAQDASLVLQHAAKKITLKGMTGITVK